jgi:hypothetical protein
MFQYTGMVIDAYEKEADKIHPGLSRTRDFGYPPVLPIVFYDGTESWTAQKNFSGRTRMKEKFGKYIPSFEYELVDLSRYSMEDITGFRDALSVIMAADKLPKNGRSGDLAKLLKEYAENLNISLELRKLITDVLTVLLRRLGMAREKVDAITDAIEKKEENQMFDQLVEGLLEEREEIRKETWAEAWIKAETETREKTRAEAEKEAYNNKLESARKMKARGDSNEEIADILSLPVEAVAAL